MEEAVPCCDNENDNNTTNKANINGIKTNSIGMAHRRKSYGDRLFHQMDHSLAVRCYKVALGVLLTKRWKGRVAVAEVDCAECKWKDNYGNIMEKEVGGCGKMAAIV